MIWVEPSTFDWRSHTTMMSPFGCVAISAPALVPLAVKPMSLVFGGGVSTWIAGVAADPSALNARIITTSWPFSIADQPTA